MRVTSIAPRLAALALLFSLVTWPATPPTLAQTALTAEDAVRASVSAARGVAQETLIVRFVAETGGWVYASATVPAGSDEDAPVVSYVLARETDGGWIAELRYTAAFDELLREAPADFPNIPVRAALDSINLAGDGSADLSFPFPVGESWRFNGPHPNGAGRPWSSLDFYKLEGSTIAYNAPILAMRGGVVDRPCANMVVIDHGDGWSTYYYHVINITVSNGQTVMRGQRVGGTSAEYNCGGAADGPHSHIWMTWQGTEVAIAGKDIGGWTVSNGARAYDGCLTRDSVVRCAEQRHTILNDGMSGSAGSVSISPTRTTVNNWITYQVDSLPPNASGQIKWRRLSGSIIEIGSFTTNGTGVANGQFRVPATPGGPNQQITFAVGTTTRTANFEVAPRIKVVTDPGERGQLIDVSLRGYAKNEVVRIRWNRPNVGWVEVATITTSNTGSANVWVTVPSWAPDGANSVRGDGTIFRQQTNAAMISGGAVLLAGEAEESPGPIDEATPVADIETPETETPVTIDRSALPPEPPLVERSDLVWTVDPDTGEAVMALDLGEPHALNTIGWLTLEAGCEPFPRIETSSDGATWTPADRVIAPVVPAMWQTMPLTADARFVRWVSSESDLTNAANCLAGVAIWATPIVVDPTPFATEPTDELEIGTPVPASEETDVG